MLSNTELGKEFWTETLSYANHLIISFLATANEGKTPLLVILLLIIITYIFLICPTYIMLGKVSLILEPRKSYFWTSAQV